MPAPTAGTATTGKTGSLAISINGGATFYLPIAGFNPQVASGRDLIALLNNAAFPSNEIIGVTMGAFDFTCPLVTNVLTASVLTSLVNSVLSDDGASNYFTLTFYPDNRGSLPATYAKCKMSSFSLSVSFSTSGVGSAVGCRFSGMSLDPESITVSALAAPGAAAVAPGNIKSYANTNFTGATSIVSVGLQVSTGLAPVPGEVTSASTDYPNLVPALLQTGFSGSLSLTQLRNAATVLSDGGFTLAVGGTGDGVSFATNNIFMNDNKPSSQSINYRTRRYQLKSVDGVTSPLVMTAL